MFASMYVTVSDEVEGKKIAKILLEKKLIACANLYPIDSLYNWEGSLQEDKEIAIIMKTRSELVEELIEELKSIHSYDVPCIVSWEIVKGNPEYLSWVKDETREP
jgi:periplasmic divalent cation tolerance protein